MFWVFVFIKCVVIHNITLCMYCNFIDMDIIQRLKEFSDENDADDDFNNIKKVIGICITYK